MFDRDGAAWQIGDLFDDGGAAVLHEAGLRSWGDVLEAIPDGALANLPNRESATLVLLAREVYAAKGELRPALALTRAAWMLAVERGGEDHPDALLEIGAMGALFRRGGRDAEGGQLLEDAWYHLRSRAGGMDLRVAVVASNLASFLRDQGRLEEAEVALTQAWRIRRAVAPKTVSKVAAMLGELRVQLGRTKESLDPLREAWLSSLDTVGGSHPQTLQRARTLARVLTIAGLPREAAPVLRDLYEHALTTNDRDAIATAAYELGLALDGAKMREESQRLVEDALRYSRSAGDAAGKPHPALPERLVAWAQIQLRRGRPHETESLLREALEAERRLHGDASYHVALRYAALGRFVHQLKRPDEALGYLDVANSLLRGTLGDDDERTVEAVDLQVQIMLDQAKASLGARDRDMAQRLISRALRVAEQVLGFDHDSVRHLRELASFNQLKLDGGR